MQESQKYILIVLCCEQSKYCLKKVNPPNIFFNNDDKPVPN